MTNVDQTTAESVRNERRSGDRTASKNVPSQGERSPDRAESPARPYLSVVAPCYNEEASIEEFYRRVSNVCGQTGRAYEIVLVNDGSTDATWTELEALARVDARVVAVNLSRNFGHESALAAGLATCRGELILVLDADLQDPPELLPEMIESIDRGADVVYGTRRSRAGESRFKKFTASMFYSIMSRIGEISIPRDTGNFRLMKRRVLDAVLGMREHGRFTRGLVAWAGFRQESLLYDRESRDRGESHLTVRRMTSLAIDAITGFSARPLRWAGWFAVASYLLAFATFSWWLTSRIVSGDSAYWLLTISIVAGFGGIQLTSIYVLGEYVARISEETRNRPLFVIDRVINCHDTLPEPTEASACRTGAEAG